MNGFNKQDVFYTIRGIIQKLYQSTDLVLSSVINSHITFNDLKLTENEKLRIILSCEEKFGVTIEDEEINGDMQLGEVVNVVADKLKAENRLLHSTYMPLKRHKEVQNTENQNSENEEEDIIVDDTVSSEG